MLKKTMHELYRASVSEVHQLQKMPLLVILDNIRSMNNVGSVFRTCDALAVQHVYLCGVTPVPPHRDITKTALGATETVAWSYAENAKEVVQLLQKDGYTCIAIEQVHNSVALHDFMVDSTQRYAIVLGNEVEGVQQAVIDVCGTAIEIPQHGSKHSLNISVTAGVVLWHFYQSLRKHLH